MLTLQFIPHQDIQHLDIQKRMQKILEPIKNNQIVVLEGKLEANEEAELIQETMREIDEKFKGIEFSYIHPHPDHEVLIEKIRSTLLHLLLGDREGFTVIGPNHLIKEIKKAPHKIQLFTEKRK
ncbi:MAG TPA: DUF2073 domain-containing protein [Candidatus Nanoarchaeia archaeon]|nr:DUF2073 domain-containing protein [Candidatus Nanoarchaeia archaeon]